MADLVRQAAGDLVVRARAEEAVRGTHPRDLKGQLAALRDWLADRVEYRRDPVGREWLQDPRWIIRCQIDRGLVPQLDCDDLATLYGAPAMALGFPYAFRVVSTRPDRRYNHVYGVARAGHELVAVDLTRAWERDDAPRRRETRVETFPVAA